MASTSTSDAPAPATAANADTHLDADAGKSLPSPPESAPAPPNESRPQSPADSHYQPLLERPATTEYPPQEAPAHWEPSFYATDNVVAESLAPEAATRAVSCWTRLERLIDDLEDRVQDFDGGEPSKRTAKRASRGHGTQPDEKEPPTPTAKAPTTIIPEVRYCNYQQFVNRFPSSSGPIAGIHAIEALVSGSQLGKEIFDEWEERCRLGVEGYNEKDEEKPSARRYGSDSTDPWIHRVRIQSPTLLRIFDSVTGYGWGTKPHTFLRPFRYMIHFHDKLKARLQWMETNIEQLNLGGEIDIAADSKAGEDLPLFLSETALEELRCYINFAETEIVPLYNSFADADFDTSRRVRFHDLWYLFRPGELIYMPRDTLIKHFTTPTTVQEVETIGASNRNHGAAALQTVWRIFYARPKHGSDALMEDFDDSDDFTISCYYLDYDGSSYAAVPYSKAFRVSYFKGKKDIRDLPFYPIRFAQDWKALIEDGRVWGEKFLECIEKKHLFYAGWTVINHPVGNPIASPDYTQTTVKRPEHIESDMIVDFQEAFNNCPEWKLFFADEEPWIGRGGFDATTNGRDAIITWSDAERSKQISSVTEVVVDDDDIDTIEHDFVISNDPFLRTKTRASKPKPTGDDLALLPRRLFAYAIRERKFVLVDVRHLKPIEEQTDVFDKLELRPEHKRHIEALVQAHFRRKDLDEGGVLRTQDLIRGKGKGVVILLHGAPGVGKTATAEAVAQKFRRPLFPITCGDLGFNPQAVEEKLTEIFRLAHLWDCVLLLDEADVFLSARSANDIKRNGLVSVFLRILEYYNGVLFLTTNRVGKLDPAVTSRVHVIMHYRRLRGDEVRNIFKLNIERLEQIEQQRFDMFGEPKLFILKDEILQFAEDHYRESTRGKDSWNGRQIRNAFLIASSLARYEIEQQPAGFQPQLRASHFREVEKITREYDGFRMRLNKADDAETAQKRGERDDSWDEAENLDGSTSLPPMRPGKVYHSPMSSTSNLHTGYQPPQRGHSPHSTPSRPPMSGTTYSAPAHPTAEYGQPTYSTPSQMRSHDAYQRQYQEPQYGAYASPSPQYRGPPPEHRSSMPPQGSAESSFSDRPGHAMPPGTPYSGGSSVQPTQ